MGASLHGKEEFEVWKVCVCKNVCVSERERARYHLRIYCPRFFCEVR